jgi:glycosyltransferase involved in cell wall biosynthesis
VVLKVISQKFPELPGVRVLHQYWREEEEVEQIGTFDLGLMPLGDDLWSRGKCGLKLLKYMALGIPVVATATEANRDIVTDGIEGFLVLQPGEWLEKLGLLIETPGLRDQMGRAGREKAETSFSYQAINPLFRTILEKVYSTDNLSLIA